jgi:hypothetical protein
MTAMNSAHKGEREGSLRETPGFEAWVEEIVSVLHTRREEGAGAVAGVEYATGGEPPELPEQLFPGPYVETLSEARTKLAARFQHPSRSVGL